MIATGREKVIATMLEEVNPIGRELETSALREGAFDHVIPGHA